MNCVIRLTELSWDLCTQCLLGADAEEFSLNLLAVIVSYTLFSLTMP